MVARFWFLSLFLFGILISCSEDLEQEVVSFNDSGIRGTIAFNSGAPMCQCGIFKFLRESGEWCWAKICRKKKAAKGGDPPGQTGGNSGSGNSGGNNGNSGGNGDGYDDGADEWLADDGDLDDRVTLGNDQCTDEEVRRAIFKHNIGGVWKNYEKCDPAGVEAWKKSETGTDILK